MKFKTIGISIGAVIAVAAIIVAGVQYKNYLDKEESYRAFIKDVEYSASRTKTLNKYMEDFLVSEQLYSCEFISNRGELLSKRASLRFMKDAGGQYEIKSLNKGLELEVNTNVKKIYNFKREQNVARSESYSVSDSIDSYTDQTVFVGGDYRQDILLNEENYLALEGTSDGTVNLILHENKYSSLTLNCSPTSEQNSKGYK